MRSLSTLPLLQPQPQQSNFRLDQLDAILNSVQTPSPEEVDDDGFVLVGRSADSTGDTEETPREQGWPEGSPALPVHPVVPAAHDSLTSEALSFRESGRYYMGQVLENWFNGRESRESPDFDPGQQGAANQASAQTVVRDDDDPTIDDGGHEFGRSSTGYLSEVTDYVPVQRPDAMTTDIMGIGTIHDFTTYPHVLAGSLEMDGILEMNPGSPPNCC